MGFFPREARAPYIQGSNQEIDELQPELCCRIGSGRAEPKQTGLTIHVHDSEGSGLKFKQQTSKLLTNPVQDKTEKFSSINTPVYRYSQNLFSFFFFIFIM